MVLRDIKCGKVIIFIFDLEVIIYFEAHGTEYFDQLVSDLGYRVKSAAFTFNCRHGNIYLFIGIACFCFCLF